MSDTLRSKMIRMASELPKGDPTRRELLTAVREAGRSALLKKRVNAEWVVNPDDFKHSSDWSLLLKRLGLTPDNYSAVLLHIDSVSLDRHEYLGREAKER
jgi:hypothetical protein